MTKFVCIVLAALLWSCGTESSKTPVGANPTPAPTPPGPSPTPGPGGDDGAALWAKAQPIIAKNCASCHASEAFIKSLAGWRASEAKEEVASGAMPPGKPLSPQDKAALTAL